MFLTMKKTYIIPTVEVLNIAPGTLLAESLPKGDDVIDDPDDILVKGQGSSRGTHDVWDDDWSK
jgi:hypothetical protein